MPPVVTTAWLAAHLDDPAVRVVDARWYLRPFDAREGDVEYRAGHIPGAVHVRWDTDLADPRDATSGMLAPPELYAAAMSRLGIGDDTFVVAYDDHHVPVAARVWWTLQAYGHDRAAVLDGGITRWQAEGRPLDTDVPAYSPAVFTPRPQPDLRATKADVLAALSDPSVRIVDARMDSAYEAATGHIPGSTRLTGIGFLADGEHWMEPEAARRRIAAVGVDTADRTILYCGAGVAATGAALAFTLAGVGNWTVYDGSWAEWEADPDTPKEPH